MTQPTEPVDQAVAPPKHGRAATTPRPVHAALTGQQMADLFVAGISGEQIATQARVTPGRVTQMIRAATGMTPSEWRLANGWLNQSIPPTQADVIADAYMSDLSASMYAVATRLGVPLEQVQTVVRVRSLGRRASRRNVLSDAGQVSAIVDAYREGQTTTSLAEEFGVDEATIRRRLDEAHVARRGRGPTVPTSEARSKVLAAWKKHQTLAGVHQETGVARRRARRLLIEAGVPESVLSRRSLSMS